MLFSTLSGSTPWLIVRLPCGSMSTASTLWPDCLKETARLSAVVGLATPPFWFANAITLAWPEPLRFLAPPLGLEPLAAFDAFLDAFADRLGPTTWSGLRRPLSPAWADFFLRHGDICARISQAGAAFLPASCTFRPAPNQALKQSGPACLISSTNGSCS